MVMLELQEQVLYQILRELQVQVVQQVQRELLDQVIQVVALVHQVLQEQMVPRVLTVPQI